MEVKVKFTNDEDLIKKTPNSFKNRPADEDNLHQMREWLDIIVSVCPAGGYPEDELQSAESSLGIRIPSTLRLMYAFAGKGEKLLCPELSKGMKSKIVRPEELQVKKNVLVYDPYDYERDAWYETDVLIYDAAVTRGKPHYGIDIRRDWNLDYYARKWLWVKDSLPLYKVLPVALVCNAITHMRNSFKTKVKGISHSLHENLDAEKKFKGWLDMFPDFEHYGHTLFFSKEHKALGWFRAGSAIPDLFMGCDDKAFVDEFVAQMEMKAKHIKIDGTSCK